MAGLWCFVGENTKHPVDDSSVDQFILTDEVWLGLRALFVGV